MVLLLTSRVNVKHTFVYCLRVWDVPLDFLGGIFRTFHHSRYQQWLCSGWILIDLLISWLLPFERFLRYYEMKTCLKGNAFFFKQTELIWVLEKCALHTLELFFRSLTSSRSLLTHTCRLSGVFGKLKRLNLTLSALFRQVLTQQ